MSAFVRIRGASTLLMSLMLLSLPLSLGAQTTRERAREREVRQELERLEMRLREVREEELARMESRLRGVREQELARIEEALVRARERSAEQEVRLKRLFEAQAAEQAVVLAEAQQMQEQALALRREQHQEQEARARALVEELQAARVRVQASDREARDRAEDAYRRALQEARRAQEFVVNIRSRVRLGVSLNGSQGEEYDAQGARLEGVIDDSPAEEAGLREGDIITHLNGQSLLESIPGEQDEEFDQDESLPVQRLIALAGDLDEGEEVVVRYLRDGQSASVTFEAADVDQPVISVMRGDLGDPERFRGFLRVEPEGRVWHFELPEGKERSIRLAIPELKSLHMDELEDLKELRLEKLGELEDLKLRMSEIEFATPEKGFYALRGGEGPLAFYLQSGKILSGLELTELNEGLAEYFSTDRGVLVLDADDDSPLGLLPGDVILSIGGRETENPGDVRRILGSYEEGETVSLTVMRRGSRTTVEGTIR